MPGLPGFFLTYASPLPEGEVRGTVDLNPLVTDISVTTGLGGWVGMQVGYVDDPGITAAHVELEEPVEISDFYHVELWARSAAGFKLFEGRVVLVNQLGGLAVTALQASSYGASDGAVNDSFFDSNDPRLLTGGELLDLALPTVTRILPIGGRDSFIDPGPGSRYAPNQKQGQTAGQIIDQVVKAGSDAGLPEIYECYDRHINIRPFAPPAEGPEYVVQPSDVKWARDSSKLYGAVSVEYQPKGGTKQRTAAVVDESFPARYGGLVRNLLVPNSEMDQVQAEMLARRLLYVYRNPIITGTLELTERLSLITAGGGFAPYWQPRAWEWVQVGTGDPMCIVATSLNLKSGTNTLTISNVP